MEQGYYLLTVAISNTSKVISNLEWKFLDFGSLVVRGWVKPYINLHFVFGHDTRSCSSVSFPFAIIRDCGTKTCY